MMLTWKSEKKTIGISEMIVKNDIDNKSFSV